MQALDVCRVLTGIHQEHGSVKCRRGQSEFMSSKAESCANFGKEVLGILGEIT